MSPHRRPVIMGVLNVTPDSFADGGCYVQSDQAVAHAQCLASQGADIIDIGGESTRPGAKPVSLAEELDRVIPVIEKLRQVTDVPLSIDTYKPEVMVAAVAAGVSMINDVKALQMPGALEAMAALDVPVCLMHMAGTPQTMQAGPHYVDVMDALKIFFQQRIEACCQAGIDRQRLWLDPGFGFGKTVAHNLTIIRRLPELASFELPLLLGVSRKSTIGMITGRPANQRLAGSLALAALAIQKGVSALRVHDVAHTMDVAKIVAAATDF